MKTVAKYFIFLALTLSEQAHSEIDISDHGAVCDGSTDDTSEINAALTAAKNSGGGSVVVKYTGNDCIISSPLEIGKNVQLRLEHGVKINSTTNNNVIEIMDLGASVVGGHLHNSNTSFSKAIILIDTENLVTTMRKAQFTGAANVEISAVTSSHMGTGIALIADGSDSNTTAVQYTLFDNVNIHDLDTCIYMETKENNGETAFVNGNMFSNILMEDCVIFIEGLISGTGSPVINGNKFTNIQIQTDTDSEKAIKLTGGDFSRNSWSNMVVWDWSVATSDKSIEISGNSTNSFFSLQGVTPDDMILGDGDNLFVGSRSIPMNIPVINSASLPAAGDYVGAIVFVNNLGNFVFSNGVKWRIIKFDGSL